MLRWPAEAIWEAVVPWLPHFTLEVLPTLDSTNSELMRRARAGQCEPVLLVAERQTAGRGRLGRTWHSDAGQPGGVLTFSLGLPLVPQDWSGLSLAVGLSLAQSLHPDIQLKWPNDLWWQERKLAGVLIETVSVGNQRYVVIGVGINIRLPDATGLATAPAALQELLPDVDAPAALQRVVAPLVQAVQRFAEQGFGPLVPAFARCDALAGRALVCSDGLTGLGQGVDASGALLLQTDAGLQKISTAEVSVRPYTAPSPSLS